MGLYFPDTFSIPFYPEVNSLHSARFASFRMAQHKFNFNNKLENIIMILDGKQLSGIGLGLGILVMTAQASPPGTRPYNPVRSEGLQLNGLQLNGLQLNGLQLNTSNGNQQATHALKAVFPDWIDPARTQATASHSAAEGVLTDRIVLEGSQLTFKAAE
ncbi:hypothetical protein N836_34150 [Leptolyngbya sp. Heron Island J]|uniref:hypothetical protein n=1 Tax=Leptolyngbya sp. Heron Island J TaxID=1385935 RepID=UPI0003B9BD98|nr:hypothetical protein [Leptolyngbya sp. Heron Island J]ESA37948.1 hypothetical protein N836_34150 [Leptolyngbya sp. Heron Island J]